MFIILQRFGWEINQTISGKRYPIYLNFGAEEARKAGERSVFLTALLASLEDTKLALLNEFEGFPSWTSSVEWFTTLMRQPKASYTVNINTHDLTSMVPWMLPGWFEYHYCQDTISPNFGKVFRYSTWKLCIRKTTNMSSIVKCFLEKAIEYHHTATP